MKRCAALLLMLALVAAAATVDASSALANTPNPTVVGDGGYPIICDGDHTQNLGNRVLMQGPMGYRWYTCRVESLGAYTLVEYNGDLFFVPGISYPGHFAIAWFYG